MKKKKKNEGEQRRPCSVDFRSVVCDLRSSALARVILEKVAGMRVVKNIRVVLGCGSGGDDGDGGGGMSAQENTQRAYRDSAIVTLGNLSLPLHLRPPPP